ncbi:DUF4153 domain-containing protein [Tsuneonella sp. HG094]
MTDTPIDRPEWPLRPWILGAIGAVAGFLIYSIGGGDGPGTTVGWQAAATALFFFGPLAFGFTAERDDWRGPLAFAVLVGVVMAGLAWRAVGAGESIADPQYGFLAGVIATGLALPLFQAGFHRTRLATPYRAVHHHVWSDAICAGGSLVFLGASWLLLVLLSELFRLLRIDLLHDLIDDGWFGWTWSCAAFAAALGVLRNEIGILSTLKRVVMTVLSILAVPLAAGLALFLVAMVLSGPEVLWQATRSATPILLLCAAGAWVLANAIVRDDDAEMSGNRVLRGAGLALALVVLPLTVFAAVSLGTRIAQHGLSPERLWGLIAIGVATAYGLAWFVAVVRGWKGGKWRENVRRANLHLAVAICGIALILALPIFDFGAISARSQLARLGDGRVSADDFDYAALRWDFGDAGRRALARLAKSGNPVIARAAAEARAQTVRVWPGSPKPSEIDLRVQPADPALERMVRDWLRQNPWACSETCVAIDLGAAPDGKRRVAIVNGPGYQEAVLPSDGRPVEVAPTSDVTLRPDSKVEVQTLPRRYITVDGVPIGQPLDDSKVEAPRPPR